MWGVDFVDPNDLNSLLDFDFEHRPWDCAEKFGIWAISLILKSGVPAIREEDCPIVRVRGVCWKGVNKDHKGGSRCNLFENSLAEGGVRDAEVIHEVEKGAVFDVADGTVNVKEKCLMQNNGVVVVGSDGFVKNDDSQHNGADY